MIRRGRRAALAGGALLVAAALTSCIKVDADIELDDGAASGSMVLAVSRATSEQAGGDADRLLEDIFADIDVPDGATVEPYEDDEYVGERYTFEDVEVGELSTPGLSITYDEAAQMYEVDGQLDFTAGENDIPPAIVESFDASISITFSGDVIEHNGGLDGNTVTWQPAFGEITELHAVGEEGSGAPAWLSDVLGVLAVLFVVGLVAILVYRRSTQDVRAEGAVPVPAGRVATDALGRYVGPDEITQDLPAADDAAQDVTRRPASDGTTRDLTEAADAAARDVTQDPPPGETTPVDRPAGERPADGPR